MTDRLEALTARLKATPPDRDLSALEPLVWRRIDEVAAGPVIGSLSPGASLAAARLSLGAIALLAGLLAGMAVATQTASGPRELAVFSADSPFGSGLPRL